MDLDIDKAEQVARDAMAGERRFDLPDWYWPEGTLGLVEEVRRLRDKNARLEAELRMERAKMHRR